MNTRPYRDHRWLARIAPTRRLRGAGVLLTAAALLAGCSLFGSKEPPDVTKAGPDCPKVSIVRDAARLTQFRPGAGRDQTDVTVRALVADFRGQCQPDGQSVSLDFDLALVAERGPALKGDQVDLPYFVAIVVGPERQPVAKKEFVTTVVFEPGKRQAGTKEELHQSIPLAPGRNAGDYQVLLGFQLDGSQLDYNRKTQGR